MALFPDVDSVKEQAKRALQQGEYNVEDEYQTAGVWQMLARSRGLKNATCAMIVLNAIWIGLDTDLNKAPALYYAAPVFKLVENVFCSFFTFEVVVRFLAFEYKCRAFGDAWFIFDASLVALMAWETWIVTALISFGFAGSDLYGDAGTASVFRLLRLLRLSRVLRIGRLLREIPEFLMLARGVSIAMRSVFSTLVLLMAIIYVFAIVFVQLMAKTPAASGCFENVPQAINCLFLNSAMSNQLALLQKVLAEDLMSYWLALLCFIIGSLTLMNMLIGALCEVVSVVAREQSEAGKIDMCRERLTALLIEGDANHNLKISKEEIMPIMVNPEMVRMLAELEVDVEALIHYADVVFEHEMNHECDIALFVDIVMQFRSTSSATVKDLISMRKDMSEIRKRLESLVGLR